MSFMNHSEFTLVGEIQELSFGEVEQVDGGTVFGTISAAMGAASVVSGGLAAVPTPATPGLVAFAVVTGVLSAGAAYIDSNYH